MPPISAAQIKSLYAEALKLQSGGQLEAALQRYGRIVEANPNIPEVHFQIGRIFTQALRAPRALTHFAAAARLKPAEPAIWQAWAEAAALAGDAQAVEAFLAALKTSPLPPEARIALQDRFGAHAARSKTSLGGARKDEIDRLVGLMQARRFAEAEKMAAGLARVHPNAAVVLNILASAQAWQGKHSAAIAAYVQCLALAPDYAEAHNNLGLLYLELRRNDEAAESFRKAVSYAPDMVGALTNLGVALIRKGEPAQALPFLEKAVALDAGHAPAHLGLGNAHTRLRDYEAARAALETAVALDPNRAEAHALLAQARQRLGEDGPAMEAFDRALALAPDLPIALGGKAALLQTLGRFDEAETWFRRAFEVDPTNGENYRVFIASHKTRAEDPIIGQMQAQFDRPGLADGDRTNLGFAIAKALEDTRQYDQVFRYLNEANALMRKAWPYDLSQRHRELDELRAAFAGIDWHGTTLPGTTDFAPIFVTGMPRSGTTLIEQIISSHSAVTGAGEVGAGSRMAQALLTGADGRMQPLSQIAPETAAGLGHDYAAYMRARFPETPRVTDKSIQTYLYLGLMKLAMPQSRFIVVRRDPRDTLLSIYKNKFPEGTHLYAYDLEDLGRYYRTFEAMIDFWRALVPDWFHEVEYEALIEDPEAESRKLIAACGLDWEDACLNFHENRRKVDTLSVYQVRQPISRGSLKSWQRYEADLGPLFAALAEGGKHGA